jgi:hypothetical protein
MRLKKRRFPVVLFLDGLYAVAGIGDADGGGHDFYHD